MGGSWNSKNSDEWRGDHKGLGTLQSLFQQRRTLKLESMEEAKIINKTLISLKIRNKDTLVEKDLEIAILSFQKKLV